MINNFFGSLFQPLFNIIIQNTFYIPTSLSLYGLAMSFEMSVERYAIWISITLSFAFSVEQCRQKVVEVIDARVKFFRGGRAKIARKILLHKNRLMIQSKINISSLVFNYFITCLRNKKMSLWFWKQSHSCLKNLVLIGIQLIKEYKSIVNGLIKTISVIRQELL